MYRCLILGVDTFVLEVSFKSLASSASISFSICTKPGGSNPNREAKRDTSIRHKTTFRGLFCKTKFKKNEYIFILRTNGYFLGIYLDHHFQIKGVDVLQDDDKIE